MKYKLKTKFVCIKSFKNEYVAFVEGNIHKIGEMMLEGVHNNYTNYIDRYGDEFEMVFSEQNMKDILEYFMPLAEYRDKRIDEIISDF
jgi:hypothetical protein